MRNEDPVTQENKHYFKVEEIDAYNRGKKKKTYGCRNKSFFYYLHPTHFKKQMAFSDASISAINIATYMGLTVIGTIVLSLIYKLQVWYGVILGICILLFIPALIVTRAQKKFEKQRLNDLHVYMEQVLYAFKKQAQPNILEALRDTLSIFNKNCMMKQAIEEAVKHIETQVSQNAAEEALSMIESYYHNDRLSTVHKLLLKMERIGGDCEKSINILLDDLKMWSDRMDEHKKETQVQCRNVWVAVILSALICLVTVYCLPNDMSVVHFTLYQIITVVMFYLMALMSFKAEKKTNIRWIEHESKFTEKQIKDRYHRVIHYDAKKELKKSLICAAFPAVSMVICILLKIMLQMNLTPVIVLLAIVTFFMLNQHKIGHSMCVKSVTREINRTYPRWLMEISLRMQTDNVQVSIMDSMNNAPAVLHKALEKLITGIQEEPGAIKPYTDFLSEFDVQEVHSAMKMLYAIFSGKGGDADTQIAELLSRNNNMLNQAEKISNDDSLAGIYSLFLAPALVGGLKLIADMSLVMIVFFSQVSV